MLTDLHDAARRASARPLASIATPPVRFDGVRLGHGRRVLLDRVGFDLPQGAFVGLFGANGAGKTTLLRAILGLVRPGAGRISVFGAPARPGTGSIGIMPQQRRLPPTMLDLAAGVLLEVAHPGRRAEIGAALDLVDGHTLARRRLGALSGGERQRLLLAQALVGRPRLLLLDEPLAGLDPRFQTEAIALVDRVRRQLDATVLFSAHDLNPLLETMDAVLWLAGGTAALGGVADVLRPEVLDGLYGTRMQVVRTPERVLVVPGTGGA